jgi:hypothetical protein
MSNQPEDPGAIWRAQPEETLPINLKQFVSRRTRELSSSTRAEIALSIGAALFFVAVVALRFATAHDRFQQPGLVALATVVAWALISLYWFRRRIWRESPTHQALAVTCREFYRNELEKRRDHLRSVWLWYGPLLLACLVSVALFIGKAFPGLERLRTALPLIILLALWTGFGFKRRRRQANQIQREIDEIDLLK